MSCWIVPWATSGFPKATLCLTLSTISCSARSAWPMRRMQWCILPGPSRPCAISKPRPSPSSMLAAGTRTLWKLTSAWPLGLSFSPNTLGGHN